MWHQCAFMFSAYLHVPLWRDRRRHVNTRQVHQALLTLAMSTFHRATNPNYRKLSPQSAPSLLPLMPAIHHSSCTKVVSFSCWHIVFSNSGMLLCSCNVCVKLCCASVRVMFRVGQKSKPHTFTCIMLITLIHEKNSGVLVYSQTAISILSCQTLCPVIVSNILCYTITETGMNTYHPPHRVKLQSLPSLEKIFKSTSVDHHLAGNFFFCIFFVPCHFFGEFD